METKQLISEKAANIIMAVGLSILIISINVAIFTSLFPYYHVKLAEKDIPIKQIITGLTVAPFGEELIFRFIPISLLKNTELFKENKWYIIAIIACIFGYMHGDFYHIYIQGVAGFAFGWVYVKNGMSYWSAVLAHFLYNFMIYIVIPIII